MNIKFCGKCMPHLYDLICAFLGHTAGGGMGGQCGDIRLVPLEVPAWLYGHQFSDQGHWHKVTWEYSLNSLIKFLINGSGFPPLTTTANARM